MTSNGQFAADGHVPPALSAAARGCPPELQSIFLYAVTDGPTAMAITDPNARFMFVNRKYADLTGYGMDELIGQKASLLKSGELPDSFHRELWQTLEAGREWRGEFHNRRKDGSDFWESACIVPVRDPDGKIGHFLKVVEDITARKLAEQGQQHSHGRLVALAGALDSSARQLRHIARMDPLTGILNRQGFAEELRRVWATARQQGRGLGILAIDIDHFKAINDTHGHLVGDQVLQECVRRLREGLRDTDLLCRHGGDELVAALPVTEKDDTHTVADRLLRMINGRLFGGGALSFPVTVSIGAAWHPAATTASEETMLIEADQALYRAKRTGRDRVVFHAQALAETPGHAVDEAPSPAVARVLVVDDEPEVLGMLVSVLQHLGYGVETCSSVEEACRIMNRFPGQIDVAMLDICLTGEDGLDLMEQLHHMDETLVCVIMTGESSMEYAIKALRRGAFDFVTKPMSSGLLRGVMDRAVHHRAVLKENRRHRARLVELVQQQQTALDQTLVQLRASYRFTLEVLAAMLDAREHATGEHSQRVVRVSRILATALDLPAAEIETLVEGARLHDLGKVAIPDAILCKGSSLTDEEWAIVKQHPAVGYSILKGNSDLSAIAEIVYSHHERFDGTGYPRGLSGNDICLGARIFAVVDAYDAIRSGRVYASPRSSGEAIEELERHAGTQFDPAVVRAAIRVRNEIEAEGLWPGHSAQS